MRRLIWPVLFLFLLVIQGAITVFYTSWLSFDLLLVALYAFTIIYGKNWGAAAGFFVGLIQDALTMGIFGFHILTRTALAYTVGSINKQINEGHLKYHLGMIFFSTLIIQGCYGVIELFLSGASASLLLHILVRSLGQALGNMLLVLPLLFVCKLLQKWVTQKDITYALDKKHESAKRDV